MINLAVPHIPVPIRCLAGALGLFLHLAFQHMLLPRTGFAAERLPGAQSPPLPWVVEYVPAVKPGDFNV